MESNSAAAKPHCNCCVQGTSRGIFTGSSPSLATSGAIDNRHSFSNDSRRSSYEIAPMTTIQQVLEQDPQAQQPSTDDIGNRRKVAKALTKIHSYLGTAAPNRFDDSEFKHGKALDFPEIPGEEQRNEALSRIRARYNPTRDADGNVTPVGEQRSTASFIGGASVEHIEFSSTPPREASPQSPQLSTTPSKEYAGTIPTRQASHELQRVTAGSSGGRLQQLQDTLEVPSPVYHSHTQNNTSGP